MKKHDAVLFTPSNEYRGCPFWAWNTTLDKAELCRQIEIFKEMGFGGFYMHVRQGLETEYLGKDFMDAIKFCVDKAKSLGMKACLYDEDRWPSGAAGGFVTKEKRFRQRFLHATRENRSSDESREKALAEGKYFFLGAFDVKIDTDGRMLSYRPVGRDEPADNKYYFYSGVGEGGEPRYNHQTYVDTLSKAAIDRFVEITHEKYAREIGGEFGTTVPTIFTDEPQVFYSKPLSNGFADEAKLPWSADFDETYEKTFGKSIADRLPELVFAGKGEENYETLYNYHKHITDRFAEAFVDNIGAWCEKHGIDFTGHVIGEDGLLIATERLGGDVMRVYKNMQLPGIDVLFDDVCLTTAKQCQSAVRQYGKRGMLSELYGVTGWDFDFRGHKFQGDWQACLGVTHRVPHLAWMSMKGEGKRDYPASISYQSPWYEKYKLLEDHYARIATAMNSGKPLADIALLHPVESFWLKHASKAETSDECERLDERFHSLCEQLLSGGFDFDYLSEALLDDLCPVGGSPLAVGKMSYRTVILCDSVTIRPHTLKILEKFKAQGGKLIIVGDTPYLSNGLPSKRAEALKEGADVIDFSMTSLFELLEDRQRIKMSYENGIPSDDLICSLREDKDGRWLFIAHIKKSVSPRRRRLKLDTDGLFVPTLYDTLTGEKKPLTYSAKNSKTSLWLDVYDLDSPLIRLDRAESECALTVAPEADATKEISTQSISFSKEEPNVLLLDTARFSVNRGELRPLEEIMRIDERVRAELGLASRKVKAVQPWYINDYPEPHTLRLVFLISCEAPIENALLAIERPDRCKISVNGKEISNLPTGFYVDRDIKTLPLPTLERGENELEIEMPFGLRTDLEACYLVGSFGVRVLSDRAVVTPPHQAVTYGSITEQGLPFYGGNITYMDSFTLDKPSSVEIEVSDYFGALVEVAVDGKSAGHIITPPYKLRTELLDVGTHTVEYKLFGNRHNTFSALHNTVSDRPRIYKGPIFWRSKDDEWSYEYQLKPMGILQKATVRRVD